MMFFAVKRDPQSFGSLVRLLVVLVLVVAMVMVGEDRGFCEAAGNSGVIPQAFFDYLQQQQQERTAPPVVRPPPPPPPPTTTLPPPAEPPTPSYQFPPPPPPRSFVPELPPVQELPPSITTETFPLPFLDPALSQQEPFTPNPQPPPVPSPQTSPHPAAVPPPPPPPSSSPPLPPPQARPSTQQLLQYQDIILQQQQELQRLQEEITRQKQLMQEAYQPTPPQLPPPQPAPTFPAPNYQFKPPTPPPKPLPAPIAVTKTGVIDFVPAEHKAAAHRPRGFPTRHRVTGTHRDWIARQVAPPANHQHYQPFPAPPQAWHRPNLASGASPVMRRPPMSMNRLPVKRISPFSSMPLPRSLQNEAMSMGRKMCITQFYESHGCIDPVRYLAPGTRSQGLMMSCSSRSSQHLCQVAGSRVPGAGRGRSKNLALMMMMQTPSFKAMLEKCLTPKTMTQSVMSMMKGGRGKMNPAAVMMMMGGGEGGGGMAALAMMNVMNKQRGGRGSSGRSGGTLPPGAARPGSSSTPAVGMKAGLGHDCLSVLPLIMAQGVEGGMLSPEMASTVSDMRKQLLPYTCQDVNYGVFFRMCCPGKVHKPSVMEMMTHCG